MASQQRHLKRKGTHKSNFVKWRKTVTLEDTEADSDSEQTEPEADEEEDSPLTLPILNQLADSVSIQQCSDGDSSPSSSTSNSPHYNEVSPEENRHDMSMRHIRQNWSSVSRLSTIPASSWKSHSKLVYHAFKVSPYIVHANYLLCATTRPNACRFPTIESFLRITESSYLPSWSDIEEDLLKILIIYRGCENLPNVLRKAGDAAELMRTTIQFCLPSIPTVVQERSPSFNEFISYMEDFCKTFILDLKKHNLKEELFARYLQRLISFFSLSTQIPIEILQKNNLYLDLRTSNPTNPTEGVLMTVEPDFQLRLTNCIFLVGEVKNFGVVQKQYENTKGHRVLDPLRGQQTGCGEPQPGTSVECGPLHTSGNASKGATSEAFVSDHPSDPSHKETSEKTGYRKLDRRETKKVNHILPQLLAQMFAAMATNIENGRQPRNCLRNECVQMGFSMEAFKLRFARLVLRHINFDTMPSLEDIRNPNVRCDVFLTQEMNLFKPSHIRLFFQVLFGIARAYYHHS